jgi:hypothetical protein
MNGQNVEMAASKDENWKFVQAQEHREMAHKVADKLVQNAAKLDTAPILTKRDDPVFSNNIIPVTTTVQGTLTPSVLSCISSRTFVISSLAMIADYFFNGVQVLW